MKTPAFLEAHSPSHVTAQCIQKVVTKKEVAENDNKQAMLLAAK